jgi:hypothetical protein
VSLRHMLGSPCRPCQAFYLGDMNGPYGRSARESLVASVHPVGTNFTRTQ